MRISSGSYWIWGFSFLLLLSACRKEQFNTSSDAIISVSSDTIRFDTVFTTMGSFTQSFKVFNNNDQKLMLSTIRLMGADSSNFHININGTSASQLSNIEMEPEDSLYVFVTVTIDPTTASLPFLINDSIHIAWNGNEKFIHLEAFGQNAHFVDHGTITGQETWNNDLPYVILNSLYIAPDATLTVNPGCKIFNHADAPIIVDGSLKVNGEKDNEVIFNGDRLDPDYRDLPASWPGMIFRTESKDNVIQFAIIKNAYQAISITAPSSNNNPKLNLHQCIIDNAYANGIFASNSSIDADNTLISNCGKNLEIEFGGLYNFTNCTMAAYSNAYLLHSQPVLQLNNYSYASGNLNTKPLQASFINSIFWGESGNIVNEIVVSKEGTDVFDVNFNNCIHKNENLPTNAVFANSINNISPQFDSIDVEHRYYDFRTSLNPLAPGIDQGAATNFNYDLDHTPRMSGTATDIGCYERQ